MMALDRRKELRYELEQYVGNYLAGYPDHSEQMVDDILNILHSCGVVLKTDGLAHCVCRAALSNHGRGVTATAPLIEEKDAVLETRKTPRTISPD